MKQIYGLMPPMITIFNKDESIDEKGTRNHVDYMIANGVQALIPVGSTGEFAAMTLEERKKVAEIVVDQVRGRVPVYIGTAHYSTKIAIEMSKHAESIGADGVMVIAPYYLLPTEREIMEHYRAIAASIKIPLMLYNNVWFAKVELSPSAIAKLANEGVVKSVKEAHGDPSRIHDLKLYTQNKLTVFYGHDVCAFEGLAVGADGWIAGVANLFPRQCRKLCDLILVEKDMVKAREYWATMLPFIHMCVDKVNGERPDWLQIIKEGLDMIGQHGGTYRRPALPLRDETKKRLREVLVQQGMMKA